MGLCKTSIVSIFTFIEDNDLKFCTRSYMRLAAVWAHDEWKSLQK